MCVLVRAVRVILLFYFYFVVGCDIVVVGMVTSLSDHQAEPLAWDALFTVPLRVLSISLYNLFGLIFFIFCVSFNFA